MGKNKTKSFNKQKLSNFTKTGYISKDMIEDLDDDFNEMTYATNQRRKL